jgi:DNA-binding NarL/FixJ family response regulator
MSQIIKIGMVEDQLLFRQGIKHILEGWENFKMVFESPDGYSMKKRLEQNSEIPNIMLVDITLPPDGSKEFNGSQVVQVLKQYYPEMKILILSVHEDSYLMAKFIEEGANGYLVKDSDPNELHDAIVAICERGSYINERSLNALQGRLIGKITKPKNQTELTNRELEVLRLICQQKTTSEIANELFISSKTVNGHRNNLLQKTDSKNMSGLVMYAIKHHIVEAI